MNTRRRKKRQGRRTSLSRKLEIVKNLSKALDIDNGVFQEILSNGIRTKKKEEKERF